MTNTDQSRHYSCETRSNALQAAFISRHPPFSFMRSPNLMHLIIGCRMLYWSWQILTLCLGAVITRQSERSRPSGCERLSVTGVIDTFPLAGLTSKQRRLRRCQEQSTSVAVTPGPPFCLWPTKRGVSEEFTHEDKH